MDEDKFMVSLLEEMADSEVEAFCYSLKCDAEEEMKEENKKCK